jgi:Ni,Fe-hydrogenase III component G
MKWIITKNNKPILLKDIPEIDIDDLRSQIIRRCKEGKRVVSFFGDTRDKAVTVYTVLADDENSNLLVSSAVFGKKKSYTSITREIPSFQMFERELFEETGILPENHPWLKYVRFGFNRFDPSNTMETYPFLK